jgi:hypothetical protein
MAFGEDFEKYIDAVDSIKICEDCYSWQFESFQVEAVDARKDRDSAAEYAEVTASGQWKRSPGKAFVRGSVRFSPWSGKYKLQYELIGNWEDSPGSEKQIAMRNAMAFDGTKYYFSTHKKAGSQLPVADAQKRDAQDAPPMFEITYINNEVDAFGFVMSKAGYWAFPPNICYFDAPPRGGYAQDFRILMRDAKVSGALKAVDIRDEKYEVAISIGGDERFAFSEIHLPRLTIAPSLVRHRMFPNGPVFREAKISREIKSGISVPVEVVMRDFIGGVGSEIRISNVFVDPPETGDSYSLQPPIGAVVFDHERKLKYTMADTPINEAQAIKNYLNEHSLVAADPPSRSLFLPTIVILSLVACVAILLRKQFRVSILVFITLWTWPQTQLDAQEIAKPTNEALTWNHGWQLSKADHTQPVRITQCGFTAAVAVLGYHSCKYDADAVARAMPPQDLGIRASDLVRVLESYGIQTDSRRVSSFSQIDRNIDSSNSAVAAVRSTIGLNHYLVFVRQKGKLLVLDPPHAPALVGKGLEARLKDVPVIFCSKAKPFHEQVILDHKDRIFQKSDLGDDGLYRDSILITSIVGRSAIVEVKKPCGCISVAQSSALLEVNKPEKIDVSIDSRRWGVEGKEMSVCLVTTGGNEVFVRYSLDPSMRSNGTNGSCMVQRVVDVKPDEIYKILPIHVPKSVFANCLDDGQFLFSSSRTWCQVVKVEDGISIEFIFDEDSRALLQKFKHDRCRIESTSGTAVIELLVRIRDPVD